MNSLIRTAAAALLGLAAALPAGAVTAHPTRQLADARMWVRTPHGSGLLPLVVSRDWNHPLPGVRRALIVIHGFSRDAGHYEQVALRAVAQARANGLAEAGDTIVIAPQFLLSMDVAARHLDPRILHWNKSTWESGGESAPPGSLSSFTALDAILARLADRRIFPALDSVVIVGHSGGGQVVQRYALIGRGPQRLPSTISLRFVVANPSSYAWFGPLRPDAHGAPAPFDAAACPRYDRWKYGLLGLPPYAAGEDPGTLERRYLGRDVVYLLGGADTNPMHPELDRSCMAEAQGPYRLARGLNFVRALHALDPARMHQRVLLVPGVGHDVGRMLDSPQGLRALFGAPTPG